MKYDTPISNISMSLAITSDRATFAPFLSGAPSLSPEARQNKQASRMSQPLMVSHVGER